MVCKNCGAEVKKNWKFCPYCSKKIFKIHKVIIISEILIILAIPIIKYCMPINENYIEKYLKRTYKEDFSNVTLIKSVENPDSDLSCDGTSFGTYKGEGSTVYYKVYSDKNDIEFMVYYDTSDKFKNIIDTYQGTLNRRNTLLEAYKTIYKYFNNKDYTIKLSSYNNKIKINSEDQLNDILSIYDESYSSFQDIEININKDLDDFIQTNYDNIIKLNDELVALKNNNGYYFATKIILNAKAVIELYNRENKPYVYDKYGSLSSLDEFVTKEIN